MWFKKPGKGIAERNTEAVSKRGLLLSPLCGPSRSCRPGQPDRGIAGVVGGDLNVIVLGGAAALLLQPPDTLPDLGEAFLSARPGQAFREPVQGLLEAFSETLGRGLFLLGPLPRDRTAGRVGGSPPDSGIRPRATRRRAPGWRCPDPSPPGRRREPGAPPASEAGSGGLPLSFFPRSTHISPPPTNPGGDATVLKALAFDG